MCCSKSRYVLSSYMRPLILLEASERSLLLLFSLGKYRKCRASAPRSPSSSAVVCSFRHATHVTRSGNNPEKTLSRHQQKVPVVRWECGDGPSQHAAAAVWWGEVLPIQTISQQQEAGSCARYICVQHC